MIVPWLGKFILAFEHDSSDYYLIDTGKAGLFVTEGDTVTAKQWPYRTSIIGAAMAPDFHHEELSFVFVRDYENIMLINTQSWIVSKLVDVGKGMTEYPDL